ncbi:MAG TPA: ATP-binding cassette domain-containing protein [Nocardioidaceae bacterium]|jgi:zinc transport system ATP-binding protein|nr:ATP-binding cassette domain-containing protein [Nocardioidaceae bacterium]
MTGPAALELRSVSVGYDEHPVVVDVDLTVQRGDVVAVLGANGSGKTTLVRGLLGLARVLHGEVVVLGSSAGSRADRARIGYVPQRHTVGGPVPATVREVVASGRLARRGLIRPLRRLDNQVIDDAIEAVDLAHHAGSDLNTLSGGQQRRVLIARALAAQPDVMVMDEPTAGVDRASQEALARTVARLRDRGVTVLVVTHEVGPLADVVNRALVMHGGRVTYDGPLTPELAAGHADSHHIHDPADPTGGQHGLLGSLLGGGR